MTGINQAQQDAWNGESGHRWVADADRRDAVLAPVAEALLAAARLTAGEDLLDVGCGCGVTTLAAADAVRPGTATGLDLSEPMLDLARQRAQDDPVTFLQADAQTHRFDPDAYDVIISRFGTMFFDEPVAAFANLAAATRPTGRLCLATRQPLAANDWLLIPQSNPVAAAEVLNAAGWRDVIVDPVTVSLRLGTDAADATDYLADTGIARAVLDTIDPADRDAAIAAVTDALDAHADADGVRLDAGINLIRASR